MEWDEDFVVGDDLWVVLGVECDFFVVCLVFLVWVVVYVFVFLMEVIEVVYDFGVEFFEVVDVEFLDWGWEEVGFL